ncbi:MAG TPA: TlyA family RNA methyltransferase [Candidatus Saccharimonadales bacterium]|nr:TlyA family RNA methyltransferase [Candidatus Saccharimonadales bacterium]
MNKIRLDQALVQAGMAPSRTKAAALIMAGQVKVDGRRADKSGHFVGPDAQLEILAPPPYVSRGGDKLASVADKLGLDFKGKIVLDVGSSTGGFTDYALQRGAAKVYAVDVGTGQLDWRLRNDSRVVVAERTDIRDVQELPDPIDIVVIDVSFISLRLIMPAVVRLSSPQTKVVAMAKPHFEADYVTASKHKGVIKNNTIRREILKKVENDMRRWFVVIDKADSQVLGRKGNQERFFLLKLLKNPAAKQSAKP